MDLIEANLVENFKRVKNLLKMRKFWKEKQKISFKIILGFEPMTFELINYFK